MRPAEEAAWDDLFQAQEFVERRVEEWSAKGLIDAGRLARVKEFFANRRLNLEASRREGRPCPGEGNGLPRPRAGEPAAARSLRYWGFLAEAVRRLRKEGLIGMSTGHALLDEIDGHADALRRRIELDDLPAVIPVLVEEEGKAPPPPPPPRRYLPLVPELADEEARRPPEPPVPSRPLIEVLLDPRNIQYLLVLGGALMVVGLVILLYINGVFEDTRVVASLLAAGTAATLALGWWLLKGTAHHTAGQAVTLLACLVMPLNLWYLHSNGLITIQGELWLPALVAVALYAASAWVLQDETFVYVLVLGVAGAGLLMIAKAGQFWEVVAPASLLVVLGLLCIHTERAFPDEKEGAFTRRRFGLAFFWGGHVALAAGLLLVLGAFVTGKWLYPIFEHLYKQAGVGPSSIVGENHWVALTLVLAATYAYVYSDLVVRHVGHYVHAAALMFLWAAVLVIEELQIKLGAEALIAVLAGLGLAVNLLQETTLKGTRYTRSFPVVGLLLPLAALAVGLWLFGQIVGVLPSDGGLVVTWGYVVAMAVTIVSCRVGAHLYRESADGLADLYFIATAAATLVGAASLLAVLEVKTWEVSAHLLILIPIAYVVAAALYRGGPSAPPLVRAAHLAALVLLLLAVPRMFFSVTHMAEPSLRLWLALLFAEALVFYALASRLHGHGWAVLPATALGCGVVWQLGLYAELQPELYTLAFAGLGLALLVGYRLEAYSDAATETAFNAGNGLLSLSFVAAALMALSRLAADQATPFYAGLCLALTVAALAALALVRERHWRRWYVVASIGQALLAFLVLTLASGLTPAQKWRIFASVAGVVVLIAAHVGHSREGERQDDLVGLGLLLGSLLVGVPQLLAGVAGRIDGRPLWYDEMAFLAAAVVLLSAGFMMQIKATTLVGAFLTAAYVLTLLIFVPWSQMNAIALTMTIGGGVLFGLGLVLSVFRDRLLALPERIKKREGVFRVLGWR